jgi:uncharacterized membrane protein YfcA
LKVWVAIGSLHFPVAIFVFYTTRRIVATKKSFLIPYVFFHPLMSFEQILPCLFGFLAAVFTGMAKTGIPGISMLGVLLMTFAFPGQERFSTGAVLPILIVGDLVAISLYRQKIQWRIIAKLLIPTIVGIALGAWALACTSDKSFQGTLALVVLTLMLFDLARKYFRWESIGRNVLFGPALGATTGLTTMYANAGAPPMYVYMAAQNLDKEQYMATWVWLFCIVNLIKLPVSCTLGMINLTTLGFVACNLLPGLLIGAFLGRRLFLWIPEKHFLNVVFAGTLLAVIGMILPLFR